MKFVHSSLLKTKEALVLGALLLLFSSCQTGSQTPSLDLSDSSKTLSFLEKMKEEKTTEEALETDLTDILKTQAYRYMFYHYNRPVRPHELPEKTFLNMILSLKFPHRYTLGENKRADSMLPNWQRAQQNLSSYKRLLEKLSHKSSQKKMTEAIQFANSWLPKEMQPPDAYSFVLPQGGSDAFVVPRNKVPQASQGFDLFKMLDEQSRFSFEKFLMKLAHESHHLGFQNYWIRKQPSQLERFLALVVAEGVANTAVNGLSGLQGNQIPKSQMKYKETMNKEGKKEWETFKEQREELIQKFLDDMKILEENFQQEKVVYWWGGGQKQRLYYIGVEATQEAYRLGGKKEVFKLMKDVRLIKNYLK